METMLRIEINALCLAIVAIVAWGERAGRRESRDLGSLSFVSMLHSTAAMILLDSATWLFDGSPHHLVRDFAYTANLAYYLVHTLPILFFIRYAHFQIFRDAGKGRRLLPLLALPLVMVAAATVLTPFTGFLFTFSPDGFYKRGWGFPAFAALSYIVALSAVGLIVANRRRVSAKVFVTLLSYPVPVILAGVFQLKFFGLVLIWPAMAIFLLVASQNIQRARASTDHLTGTSNRRSLDEVLESRIAGARHGKGFGAILVDLDDFKVINDRFGHDMGDRALEDAAGILRSVVRSEDLVARFGGDEFVIVAVISGIEALEEVADRLARRVEAFNGRGERPYRLALSMGAAVFDPDVDVDARSFLARVDALMYADKAGRKSSGAKQG